MSTAKIHLLQAGDRTYLTSLYKEVLPTVISWVQKNNGDSDDAYDVFHDALEALIKKAIAKGLSEDLNLEGLLVQICKNKWIDQIRRKKTEAKVRSAEADRYDSEYSSEPELIAVEEESRKQTLLKTTYAKLSATCKKLLEMIMAGKSTADIVSAMDMTNANTMYRRKHACMQKWKTYIEDNDRS